MSKIKCGESQLQCTTSVCKTKCPYGQEMQHLQRVTLKIEMTDVYLWTWVLVLFLIGFLCHLFCSQPPDLLKRDKPFMTLTGKAYTNNVVCSFLLQRASHSLLFLHQSFGQLWIKPWDHSQVISQNEQAHPLSEQEQAQLIWTSDSRHVDDAKFSFLNQRKSFNTNPTHLGLSNTSKHSCAMEHTLCYHVIKARVSQTVSQPSLYFRHF